MNAAKDLIWERGIENMSPRDVMERSGAGQGSLYHHFRSKQALALAALEEMKAEEIANVDAIFDPSLPPLERIENYFRRERQMLRGCRMGRIANEGVIEDGEIRAPVAGYLDHITGLIAASLAEARERGEIRPDIDAAQIAATLMAIIEGGFVLARVHWDAARMREVLAGGLVLVAGLRVRA
ncbi:MAG: TetR/AcrR family transcriptional regulator [Methylobacterium sp.]|nr:TetR/AcrR family transcriptional regulator [Methylobacterium sp.]